MKIYVCGNPLLKEDSIALKIAKKLSKKLKKVNFEEFEAIEDLDESVVYIMDVVKGIRKVKLIEDFDVVKTDKIFSLHDYDLSYEIKLLKKIGKIKKVFLIAIPFSKNEKKIVKEVEDQIHLILRK